MIASYTETKIDGLSFSSFIKTTLFNLCFTGPLMKYSWRTKMGTNFLVESHVISNFVQEFGDYSYFHGNHFAYSLYENSY